MRMSWWSVKSPTGACSGFGCGHKGSGRQALPRDTLSALRGGRSGFVAAAGASRTYRRAYPAASDLVGIYADVGNRLDGTSIIPSFRFATSESRGSAIGAIQIWSVSLGER